MSSHFTYEIDERNLRVKLKDFESPKREDAWQSLENATLSFKEKEVKHTAINFNFAFNRNIVLPLIFSGIIIAFSAVLFNFISIKNPKNSEVVKPILGSKISIIKPKIIKKSAESLPKILTNEIKKTDTIQALKKQNIENIKLNLQPILQQIVEKPEEIIKKNDNQIRVQEKRIQRKQKKNNYDKLEAEQLLDVNPTLIPE